MSQELNYGRGIVAPFKAKEGTITISTASTAGGDIKVPVLSGALSKGAFVEIDGDMTVKALDSGVPIGMVYNNPKWNDKEPRTNYTQAQAISAGMLREVGIETFFKKIITLKAKASENITVGKYLVLKDKVELSASSGATATNAIALSAQDTNDKVIVGIL